MKTGETKNKLENILQEEIEVEVSKQETREDKISYQRKWIGKEK